MIIDRSSIAPLALVVATIFAPSGLAAAPGSPMVREKPCRIW